MSIAAGGIERGFVATGLENIQMNLFSYPVWYGLLLLLLLIFVTTGSLPHLHPQNALHYLRCEARLRVVQFHCRQHP